MRFNARLEDLVTRKVLVEFPLIRAPCYKKAMAIVLCRLKRMAICRQREDISEFVRVSENMEGVDTAGYEFDVLPEELRRYALVITQIAKKK